MRALPFRDANRLEIAILIPPIMGAMIFALILGLMDRLFSVWIVPLALAPVLAVWGLLAITYSPHLFAGSRRWLRQWRSDWMEATGKEES